MTRLPDWWRNANSLTHKKEESPTQPTPVLLGKYNIRLKKLISKFKAVYINLLQIPPPLKKIIYKRKKYCEKDVIKIPSQDFSDSKKIVLISPNKYNSLVLKRPNVSIARLKRDHQL